jgi:hypothetical protein
MDVTASRLVSLSDRVKGTESAQNIICTAGWSKLSGETLPARPLYKIEARSRRRCNEH